MQLEQCESSAFRVASSRVHNRTRPLSSDPFLSLGAGFVTVNDEVSFLEYTIIGYVTLIGTCF